MGVRAACTLLSVLAVLPAVSCSGLSSTPAEPHRSKIVAFVRGMFSKLTKDYCPMSEGTTWTFNVLNFDPNTGSVTANNQLIVKNLVSRELQGRTVTPQIYNGNTMSFVYQDSTGCYSLAHQEPGDLDPKPELGGLYCYLKYPAELGTSWSKIYVFKFFKHPDATLWTGPMTSRIQAVDETVTVPAGTYTGCIRSHGGAESIFQKPSDLFTAGRTIRMWAEEDDWFAPGIGTIKWVLREKSTDPQFPGGHLVFELTSITR